MFILYYFLNELLWYMYITYYWSFAVFKLCKLFHVIWCEPFYFANLWNLSKSFLFGTKAFFIRIQQAFFYSVSKSKCWYWFAFRKPTKYSKMLARFTNGSLGKGKISCVRSTRIVTMKDIVFLLESNRKLLNLKFAWKNC